MKTLLTLVMLSIALVTSAGNLPTNKHYRLTIEGKFISDKHVKYEVFKVNEDKTLEKIESGRGIHYFSVQVEVYAHYVIKFTSRSNKIKYLDVVAMETGYLVVDVDFHKQGSAIASYNYEESDYEITPIVTTEVCYGSTKLSNN